MLDPRNRPSDTFNPFGGINDRYGSRNLGVRVRRTAQNFENYRNRRQDEEVLQFITGEESGVCSPPLWKTSSPPASPGHAHKENDFGHLSPTARAQAIARGQRELMEMVRNMPESSYELSLKDIVDQEECLIKHREMEDEYFNRRGVWFQDGGREKQRLTAKISRSESMENRGLFLKMGFPVLTGRKKKKKKKTAKDLGNGAKVSPKQVEVLERSNRGVEADWWKKRLSVSDGSESVGFSSKSGSTGSSSSTSTGGSGSRRSNSGRKSGFLPSCWPIFFFFGRRRL